MAKRALTGCARTPVRQLTIAETTKREEKYVSLTRAIAPEAS